MAEYIEREEVYNIIERMRGWRGNQIMTDDLVRKIRKIPATDVHPERRGRWIASYDDLENGLCSQCGAWCNMTVSLTRAEKITHKLGWRLGKFTWFCPDCQAKIKKQAKKRND